MHASVMQRTQQSGFDSALIREQMMAGGPPLSPKNLDEQAERDEEEIAEVEMILETYFMSVDNTFNKLQTLCEYIDDTEVRAPEAPEPHIGFRRRRVLGYQSTFLNG